MKFKIKFAELRKNLNQSLINPNNPGPMAVIVDSCQGNPDYLETRALELINEGRVMGALKRDENTIKAIALLNMARTIRNSK